MENITAKGDTLPEGVSTTAAAHENNMDGYFSSYTDLKVHEVMLRDWPRNSAYRRFFEENSHLVQDKIVMDVGAGTGILSLFAASVGAQKVYAVEASSTADLCREIVKQNGLGDRVEVIHSTVEDLELGEGIKVDVIVSEWMGFYLLHESMLDSVIAARDKFLAPDGIMVPSAARIYLAPVNMESFLEDKFDFWTNVCGFDFSAAIPHVHQQLLREPLTTEIDVRQVVGPPQLVREFDLKTVAVSEVQALSEKLAFSVDATSTTVHGFAIWFDVDFQQGEKDGVENEKTDSSSASAAARLQNLCQAGNNWRVTPASSSVLSTSPVSPVTHWKQTVVLLPQALAVDPSDFLGCKVTLTQDSTNKRHYNIELELIDEDNYNNDDEDDVESEDSSQDEDHPVPCDCGRGKCRLIKALVEKYGEEQDALEAEAEIVDLTAEAQAAEAISAEMAEEDCMNLSEDP